jgi:hypothetical protein
MSSQVHTVSPASTLSAYLNDHLAGSKAAMELVSSLGENSGTPLGEMLGRLGTEIDADRNTLEGIMASLGIEPSPMKQAAGWMLEKLSRIRFDEHLTGSAATSRLMQLETLSLGIEGKRLLWKTLAQVADAGASLDGVDLQELVARAETQRDWIEPFRLEAAAEGLA